MAYLSCNINDGPAQLIWHEIAKDMLMRVFAIDVLRRAAHTVGTGACLKSIIDIRSICVLHEVKSLLALVSSDALTLMLSCYLFLTDRHALKPVLIFLAALSKTFSLMSSEHHAEIAALLYCFF